MDKVTKRIIEFLVSDFIEDFLISASFVSILAISFILYYDIRFSIYLIFRFTFLVLILGLMITPWVYLYKS